jgi:hypothetical protein
MRQGLRRWLGRAQRLGFLVKAEAWAAAAAYKGQGAETLACGPRDDAWRLAQARLGSGHQSGSIGGGGDRRGPPVSESGRREVEQAELGQWRAARLVGWGAEGRHTA